MMNRNAVLVVAGLTAVLLAGCGLGDRSLGSIFDSGSDARCSYQNARYADGAAICRSGRQYRCDDGRWRDLGNNCTQNASAAESCSFDGRSFASGKASCQSGTRFRCDDGAWTNLGRACSRK